MGAPQNIPSLLELTEQVAAAATSIAQYLKAKSLAEPTFHPPSAGLPDDPEIHEAKKQLLVASRALGVLSHDPLSHIREVCLQFSDSAALGVIVDWRVAHVLSLDGTAMHISEIAKKTGADEYILEAASALRLLTLQYIFVELEPGYCKYQSYLSLGIIHTDTDKSIVAHNSSSVFLVKRETEQLVGHVLDVVVPGSFKVSEAMRRWPSPVLPEETGFSLGHNTTAGFFPWLIERPEKVERFNGALQPMSQSSYHRLRTVYPWKSLGKATVVDLAGGNGHVSHQLAYGAPELSFILQDLEQVVSEAKSSCPDDLRDRFEFMVVDFFNKQEVQADAYFLRMVLHFLSDADSIRVLKAIVPAMKRGSRILVAESIIPECGAMPEPGNRYMFTQNWTMITLLNAKERTFAEYAKLFAEADPRFRLKQWGEAGGPPSSEIIEATLVDEVEQ